MKKKLIALLVIILIGLLFACNSPNNKGKDDNENKATSTDLIEEISDNRSEEASVETIEESTFIGTIEEINGDNALVSVEKGDILNSGNKVNVNLSVASDTSFDIGDKIKVGFEGDVREIYPLGINTTFVELVK